MRVFCSTNIRKSLFACLFLSSYLAHGELAGQDATDVVLISVADQKLAIVRNGQPVAQYPISTSRFGVGDKWGSYRTPVGTLAVSEKIGANAPMGAVFRKRTPTGEVLKPNTGGRDPIVTRIIWLRGLESCNANAHERGIYIHGTPVESKIGRPASYGCIRMRSKDVVEVFDAVPVGTKVRIVPDPIRRAVRQAAADTSNGNGAT